METYADKINTVTLENGEKLTEKTKKFYLELKNGRKIEVLINPERNFLLKKQIAIEIFLEKLNPESFKNINEEELVKYNSLLINFEALDKEEEKNEEKFMIETAKFLREFHKFTIQKKLNHYHFGDRRMIQNDEKWEISDFIPPLSEKMFTEYNLEITNNDIERKNKNIDRIKQNGLPYNENMEEIIIHT